MSDIGLSWTSRDSGPSCGWTGGAGIAGSDPFIPWEGLCEQETGRQRRLLKVQTIIPTRGMLQDSATCSSR